MVIWMSGTAYNMQYTWIHANAIHCKTCINVRAITAQALVSLVRQTITNQRIHRTEDAWNHRLHWS